MASLLKQIQNDYKDALKKANKVVVSVLRLLISAIHNKEIEKRARGEEVGEDEILGIIQKQIKARKESIDAYRRGRRKDLVEKEQKEIAVLQRYLPKQLAKEELEKIVQETIQETEAESLKDMGRVMKEVMGKVKGRAEGKVVSEIVKQMLGARYNF